MFEDKNLGKLTKDDEDYRANKIPRQCSCGLNVYSKDYSKHLKGGEHESRFKGKAPSEVTANNG